MTIQLAYKKLLSELYNLYDNREAENIANWVVEYVMGLPKIERIINREIILNATQQENIERITEQLMLYRPVQYVLNEAWFANKKYYVDENVLIPRPETEELVDWVVRDIRNIFPRKADKICLLDIGTGSGCIAIELKKQLPQYYVTALDKSDPAVTVAEKNAASHQALIDFFQIDFLIEREWDKLPKFDVIVSNPPYIKKSEAAGMPTNVSKHEPELALFVPDEDALVFYNAIAGFAQNHLAANGKIYVEISELQGQNVMDLFGSLGFLQVEMRKDLQGKDRMVRAARQAPITGD